jgi:ATP-dependent DNA ligase
LRAFDLLELNGDDLRREPLIRRKATLANVLARVRDGLELNEHLMTREAEEDWSRPPRRQHRDRR